MFEALKGTVRATASIPKITFQGPAPLCGINQSPGRTVGTQRGCAQNTSNEMCKALTKTIRANKTQAETRLDSNTSNKVFDALKESV